MPDSDERQPGPCAAAALRSRLCCGGIVVSNPRACGRRSAGRATHLSVVAQDVVDWDFSVRRSRLPCFGRASSIMFHIVEFGVRAQSRESPKETFQMTTRDVCSRTSDKHKTLRAPQSVSVAAGVVWQACRRTGLCSSSCRSAMCAFSAFGSCALSCSEVVVFHIWLVRGFMLESRWELWDVGAGKHIRRCPRQGS